MNLVCLVGEITAISDDTSGPTKGALVSLVTKHRHTTRGGEVRHKNCRHVAVTLGEFAREVLAEAEVGDLISIQGRLQEHISKDQSIGYQVLVDRMELNP